MERELRFCHEGAVELEQRSDGLPLIVGYAAVFHRASDPGTEFELWPGLVERIAPTAFNRAIEEKQDVRALFNHEPGYVLGRTKSGTMRLATDKVGLRYEITPPDTQAGRDVITSIRRGDISGSSFGFLVPKDGDVLIPGEGDTITRELRDVTVLDVGPVVFPAYGATSTNLRSAGGSHSEELQRRCERLKRVERVLKELRNDE